MRKGLYALEPVRTASDGYDERGARLQQGLEVVGREDVQRQQQEGDAVAADDRRRDGENLLRGLHEDADEQVRCEHAEGRPDQAEGGCGAQRILQRLPDPVKAFRAEVDGEDRLGGLTDAVRAALHEGADVDDDAVDRQRIRAEVSENLAVEQHRQDAMATSMKKVEKPVRAILPSLCRRRAGRTKRSVH